MQLGYSLFIEPPLLILLMCENCNARQPRGNETPQGGAPTYNPKGEVGVPAAKKQPKLTKNKYIDELQEGAIIKKLFQCQKKR